MIDSVTVVDQLVDHLDRQDLDYKGFKNFVSPRPGPSVRREPGRRHRPGHAVRHGPVVQAGRRAHQLNFESHLVANLSVKLGGILSLARDSIWKDFGRGIRPGLGGRSDEGGKYFG